jgi:hypothetical protein
MSNALRLSGNGGGVSKNVILSGYFGDGSDGSIRYDSGAWQTDESGSWANITTVSGKWTVSGTTLTLHRVFQFENMTIPAGATVVAGEDSQAQFLTLYIAGTLSVDGTLRAFYSAGAGNRPGASRTTAGAGNATQNTGLGVNGVGQTLAASARHGWHNAGFGCRLPGQ